MTDNFPHSEQQHEPLTSDGRMALGALQPWGNPSYLASEMGGGSPAVPWHQNMAPGHFLCPLCSGTVTASAHPTTTGLLTLACDRGCSNAELREVCSDLVPAAFIWRDDLIPEMSNAAVAAIEARLADGTLDASTNATLGGGAAVALRTLDKMRAGATTTTAYRVTNERGGVVAIIARADYPSDRAERKTIRQFHAERTIEGALHIHVGLFAGPWPLVGRDGLAADPDKRVFVVEGEKAHLKASSLLRDYVCVTSLCGSANAHKTDWSPLAGRAVVILGDNDASGADYARSVAAQAWAAGAKSVRVAKAPAGAPDKWDVADPLPDGFTMENLRHLLDAAPIVPWHDVKHALRNENAVQHWPPFRLADGHLRGRKHLVEAIKLSLAHINSGCRRALWLPVIGCLHHALGSDGLALAIAWSERGNDEHGKFREGEVERLFESFEVQPYPTPMSVRDLFWRAWRESAARSNSGEGWRPEADAMAEAELAVFESTHRKLRAGDNIFVGTQVRQPDGTYRIEYLREETVKSEEKSNKVPSFDPKKKDSVSIFTLWENHQRVKPQRLVFRPGETVGPDEFNMFQGLTMQPRAGAGSFMLYRALINRITAENNLPGDYLWKLLAYRMQHLNTFIPVCVVLMGPPGSFKSTLSGVMFRLLAPYSVSISSPDNLAGNNNGILQDKLLVQSEEIELHSAEHNNRLKNYIMNQTVDYIDKHKRQWQGDNRTFIMMTSNARVPVRVAPDDRRFLLLRVSDPFDGDEDKRSDLHARMEAELESGGYEALMYDLLNADLTGFNPRVLPKTPLFRELAGMDVEREPINNWWREHLERGAIQYGNDEVVPWSGRINKNRLYQQYAGWSEFNGPAARNAIMSKDGWARRLKELVGGREIAKRVTNDAGVREQVFLLPDHEACCLAYEKQFRCKLERPDHSAKAAPGAM